MGLCDRIEAQVLGFKMWAGPRFFKLCSQIYNQRTNGPVNAHLISGPGISINHTKHD